MGSFGRKITEITIHLLWPIIHCLPWYELMIIIGAGGSSRVKNQIEIKARLPRIQGSARKAILEAMRPQGRAGASSGLACWELGIIWLGSC